VTVYVVAPATEVGVPESVPVVVSKLIPGGIDEIVKESIAPPVEWMVKPVAAVLTVLVSADDERVKVGPVRLTVRINVRVALPAAL
jgi:hypothetical protein